MENKYFNQIEKMQDYISLIVLFLEKNNIEVDYNFFNEYNEEVINISYEYNERNHYKLLEINENINDYCEILITENYVDYEDILENIVII